MSNEAKDADLAMVRKHVNALGDHYDAVQIFVSRHDPGPRRRNSPGKRGRRQLVRTLRTSQRMDQPRGSREQAP